MKSSTFEASTWGARRERENLSTKPNGVTGREGTPTFDKLTYLHEVDDLSESCFLLFTRRKSKRLAIDLRTDRRFDLPRASIHAVKVSPFREGFAAHEKHQESRQPISFVINQRRIALCDFTTLNILVVSQDEVQQYW